MRSTGTTIELFIEFIEKHNRKDSQTRQMLLFSAKKGIESKRFLQNPAILYAITFPGFILVNSAISGERIALGKSWRHRNGYVK